MHRKNVKAIVLDVDGTLTDGSINIGQNGELFKRFYCRDGLAIIHAIEMGIQVIILTSRSSEIVNKRAEELGITMILQGATKKDKFLLDFMNKHQLHKTDIAYIGDDINDLESMKLCGIVGCPADAVKAVKNISNFVCSKKGGYGAVKEFIEWLIE